MIKLIIFDLDGVLVKSKEAHFNALNKALEKVSKKYVISYEEHLSTFDGLPTNKKLQILSKTKKLPKSKYQQIWNDKQKFTIDEIKSLIEPNIEIIELFKELKNRNLKIWVASNSIRETTKIYLLKLGLIEYIDEYLSNEDVKNPKPNCEIYLKCMTLCSVSPDETVIVEDSKVGVNSALASKANLFIVKSIEETNRKNIINFINKLENLKNRKKWKGDNMNILIPMAGDGKRFTNANYTFPKPLIDVLGKPMVQVVVDNIDIEANYIFIVKEEHYNKYNLKYLLNILAPNCKIITVKETTEGAACTALLAKEYINNDESLLIANSDQFIVWDSSDFMYNMIENRVDGGILTFKNVHPKWSYAKTDENGIVSEVAEKKPISDNATVGIYYWSRGKDYVKYAEEMIKEDIRVNNEFYICPVFNRAIKDGKKIKIYPVEKMFGLGTPEDLNAFLKVGKEWIK